MRIDNDCVRDILLIIEKNSTHEKPCSFHSANKNKPELEKYDIDKILYHLRYLQMANYIYVPDEYKKYYKNDYISDLTPTGHEFLNTIRSPKIWAETKKLSEKAGAFSLKIISAIAEGVARGAISTHFNIPID